ncbi:MAG: type II toxin-antitoxin system VapC family toxin [Luteolibacter sp.]
MAFLLDTVTLSEFRRAENADPAVFRWQASLLGQPVYLSVITLNEIWYGIRKIENRDPAFATLLGEWYANLIAQSDLFLIVPVSRQIAESAAELRATHGTPYNDALIAATAQVHGLTLATRNASDFAQTGISIVNPWEGGVNEAHQGQ